MEIIYKVQFFLMGLTFGMTVVFTFMFKKISDRTDLISVLRHEIKKMRTELNDLRHLYELQSRAKR